MIDIQTPKKNLCIPQVTSNPAMTYDLTCLNGQLKPQNVKPCPITHFHLDNKRRENPPPKEEMGEL